MYQSMNGPGGGQGEASKQTGEVQKRSPCGHGEALVCLKPRFIRLDLSAPPF